MKWRNPTFMDDMRSSSDIQDADFTNQRVPRPPLNFVVTPSPTSGLIRFTIRDGYAPRDRSTISGYRVYFVPASVAPFTTPSQRRAAYNMGSFVIEIPSVGNTEALVGESALHNGEDGYYFCRAVNNSGTEGQPTAFASTQ